MKNSRVTITRTSEPRSGQFSKQADLYTVSVYDMS